MGLREDIEKTVEYAKKFECELSVKEISERLISSRVYKEEEIEEEAKKYKKEEKNKTAEEKIKIAEKFVKLIKNNFEDILFVGITGSVAAGHPNKNDDVDLMIITKRNKLWLTRVKMRWLVFRKHLPHRKYGQKENKNELCFNMWLDEDNLKMPKNRQNLRCAIDLILVKPLLNKEKNYEKFISQNGWAKKWVATGYEKKEKSFGKNLIIKRKDKFDFNYFLNLLVFVPQYLFMKRKIKTEKVGLGFAIFNEAV